MSVPGGLVYVLVGVSTKSDEQFDEVSIFAMVRRLVIVGMEDVIWRDLVV